MGINPDDLNLIIEQAIQKVLQTNQNTTNYYKNMNKHKTCSKCSTPITIENYKKDRSVCKNCYNTNTLKLMKKRFGVLEIISSSKQDGLSNQDISNKQVRSRKQDTSNNLKNIGPDCLMGNFTEFYNNKYDSAEKAQAARKHAKEILSELIRVKAISKKQYNSLYKKCEKIN